METIRAHLPCLRCGYDLTGRSVEARCPECDLPVVASLAAALDHVQNPQVALHSPWRVACALVGCATALLLAVALQLGSPMLMALDVLLGRVTRLPTTIRLVGWSGTALLLVIVAVMLHLATGTRERALRAELGRWRAWLLVGAWVWAACATLAAVAQWNQVWLPDALRSALPWAGVAVQLPGMAMLLSGVHALLAITGRRSQTFLEANAARQSVQLLNAVAALALVFSIASPILQHKVRWLWLAHTSRALSAVLATLLLFGAAYLVANVWWVARALVLPRARSQDLLGP
jgi:hypothetical protein